MSNKTVSVENLGPIEHVEFTLSNYGVTVLSAPNGSGKSILVDAIRTAQSGSGKVPLKDGERRGALSAFGATIQIGARTRHGGALDVLSLEGKCDLAAIVEPKIKDPEAADKYRIKQLVLLASPEVSVEPFKESELFPDFDETVDASVFDAKDMVEMADRIKRSYEQAARKCEQEALKESAAMQQCQALIDETDMLAESDEQKLLEEYNAARDELAVIRRKISESVEAQKRLDEANTRFTRLKASYSGTTAAEAEKSLAAASIHRQASSEKVAQLRQQLLNAETTARDAIHAEELASSKLQEAIQYESAVKACETTIANTSVQVVDGSALLPAESRLTTAEKALNTGAKVRLAKEKQQEKLAHATNWAKLDRQAASMRVAGLATEDVLSDMLKCDQLKVSHGRLVVVGHPRGEGTLFHDLSQGERYRVVVNVAADRVGKDGVIPLAQEGWESLDVYVREELDQHAKDREVHILAIEATRHKSDGRDMVVREFTPEA